MSFSAASVTIADLPVDPAPAPEPSKTPEPEPSSTRTRRRPPEPKPKPTPSTKPTPTESATPTPTPKPTPSESPTPTPKPSPTPSESPRPNPGGKPSAATTGVPDVTLVAFWMADTTRRANGGGIFTMPLDGSAGPTSLTADRTGRDADPAWSPDGERIAFRRSTVNSSFDVYVMNANGSTVQRLVGGPASDEKPAWSPDGSQLLTVSDRTDPGKVQSVYVVNSSGGKPKPVGLGAEVVTTPVWASR